MRAVAWAPLSPGSVVSPFPITRSKYTVLWAKVENSLLGDEVFVTQNLINNSISNFKAIRKIGRMLEIGSDKHSFDTKVTLFNLE